MDTGLFVSGAMDGVVKLWDTNTLEVAQEFDFKDKVRPENGGAVVTAILHWYAVYAAHSSTAQSIFLYLMTRASPSGRFLH